MSAKADVGVLLIDAAAARATSATSAAVSRAGLEAGLTRALGRAVSVTLAADQGDAAREAAAARYAIVIGPVPVVAAALAQGHALLGATEADEAFVLVARRELQTLAALRGQRLFLARQAGSLALLHTTLARSLLAEAGLGFKDLARLEFGRHAQAGLLAVDLGLADATLVRRAEWDAWQRQPRQGAARVLASTPPVPAGVAVTLGPALDATQRAAIGRWFSSSAASVGLRPPTQVADAASYRLLADDLAGLGRQTPLRLAGATVVTADEARRLMQAGAAIVDTRAEAAYRERHLPQAISAPYVEANPAAPGHEAAGDDFSALRQLSPRRPTLFYCGGPDCWSSYKASRAALAAGFAQVFWYRGGLADWDRAMTPVQLGQPLR